MKEWLELLYGFFVANVLGYGGGPASIPLLHREIVTNYDWLNNAEFANMLALGNALPGPIATKIAAYVGYDVSGWFGAFIAIFATVFPSATALIILLNIMKHYRQSTVVKGMTLLVQPVIAILMLVLTWDNITESVNHIGIIQFVGIAVVSLALMTIKKIKIHPAFIIVLAFIYGAIFLS
ncbi:MULTISPECIES: chromate transporter [Paenibacillus]|uniref:chromate transporter n=1 Tax=Paenibacillus TaxID=44249 RepID=UPI00203D8DC7|nr:chromate transporter [Paenibacillus camelliae]MCM3635741.1 chromate transporter [Paenibacillus camelliae]